MTDPAVVTAGIAALLGERFAGKRFADGHRCPAEARRASRQSDRAGCPGTLDRGNGDLLVNADAITAVKEADAVILVEEKYASRTADIERAAELLLISEADVNGCIVL